MYFYSGYYFCTRSCWGGKDYDAKNMVVISSLDDEYGIEDFNNLVLIKKVPDIWLINAYKEEYVDKPEEMKRIKKFAKKDCYYLKPEVLKWLEKIEDTKNGEKGWCIGNKKYNTDKFEFPIWFYRRRDAMKFIKTFSIFKKPTETYNQDTYINKKLDLKRNVLVVVKD